MSELSGTPAEQSFQSTDRIELSEISRDIYPENGGELFFAFVSPLGTDVQAVVDAFTAELRAHEYAVEPVSMSDLITAFDITGKIDKTTEASRIATLQQGGNKLRERYGHDSVAKLACREVSEKRVGGKPERKAYLIKSLKHPDEAALFRTVYGHGFYLVAIHSPYERRLVRLRNSLRNNGGDAKPAEDLLSTDESESETYGQNTRETFELADFYVRDAGNVRACVARFVDLIFNALYITPTRDEYGMHMAASAAQRSADLSRQVGASIVDCRGELLAAGCNEVPKAGGGTYWPEDPVDVRDFKLGFDPNEFQKRQRFDKLRSALEKATGTNIPEKAFGEAISESGLKDLTEFGRTVHAEMDAILSCARRAQSVRRATIYTTTFPCHNCARHIVASGIKRVVYIEPYAKSEAYSLHSDSIKCDAIPKPQDPMPATAPQVRFEPFEGVAPRRFTDFFSMRHLTGRRMERKQVSGPQKGRVLPAGLDALRNPRLQLSVFAYQEREQLVRANIEVLVLPNKTTTPENQADA